MSDVHHAKADRLVAISAAIGVGVPPQLYRKPLPGDREKKLEKIYTEIGLS